MKQILIINGHPNPSSLCNSLANEYENSVRRNPEFKVERLNLSDLQFDPIMRFGYQTKQDLEPALITAQNLIKSADHLVFVYPNWWGSMPALLKGFIDRVFLPGFAFKYRDNPIPEKLLKSKTSELFVTLDTPIWYFKFIMNSRGTKIMVRSILEFCGIQNKRVTYFSPIRGSTEDQRKKYLEKAKLLGRALP